ncbi:MAG: hypothetical protein HOJ85_08865 [Ilumatobacter sp.]|uniref:hypothetical protein n=1 Tax=Ilumatobacter sp. TaxID=1967498 RepID=UPI001DE0F90D|nr:hypothetical protein [Ilumatobacter sp.]MBT5276576.1 hypothetical protein [Ilumatobacter sp.]MBT5553860.1 hypothetical protein [Ilumatobacter sp.]MBT5865536.1 hypothetical protein [Ilumatobacter sp.]MBT7428342.1 hypothetical protein [Ilumatobacter sp.]
MLQTSTTFMNRPEQATDRASARATASLGRWAGLALSLAGLIGWLGWLSWRFGTLEMSIVAVGVLALELVAISAAVLVTAGLFAGRPRWRRGRRATDADRQLPMLLGEALGLGDINNERNTDPTDPSALSAANVGPDDTGEIAWARRGLRVLGEQRRLDRRAQLDTHNLREAAWSVVALDGLRRLVTVITLVVVLFTGIAPFETPPPNRIAMLAVGIALLSIGHWLLSGGHVRPLARLIWSMASIGAGLGAGVSRSGLPIRWAMTMATLIALNISIALRGMSDRWTHGLGPMNDDARVTAMTVAFGLVAAGGIAMRRMPQPELGHYGATRRLEESSVRRLTIGLTLVVAVIGFVAGLAPAEVLVAAP